jgi:hypothetical protein
MTHFEPSNDYSPSVFKILCFSFLTIFTLGIPWFFAYEMWAEPHYWKNRWKLHRLLKQGNVKVRYIKSTSIYADKIKMYELHIEGVEYSVWIYEGQHMTLDKSDLVNNDYLGLFVGSITTSWLNKVAIRKITQLAEHTAYEDYEVMSTNCSIK